MTFLESYYGRILNCQVFVRSTHLVTQAQLISHMLPQIAFWKIPFQTNLCEFNYTDNSETQKCKSKIIAVITADLLKLSLEAVQLCTSFDVQYVQAEHKQQFMYFCLKPHFQGLALPPLKIMIIVDVVQSCTQEHCTVHFFAIFCHSFKLFCGFIQTKEIKRDYFDLKLYVSFILLTKLQSKG